MSSGKPEGPFVEMRWQTVVCPAHGEHLRVPVNSGEPGPVLLVMLGMALFEKAMANEALIREVDPGWGGEAGTATFDVERLNVVTARRPFCYWVDRDELRQAFLTLEILRIARCDVCGRVGFAGPFQTSLPMGTQEMVLCLECALDAGERLHRAHPDGGVWPADN